MLCSSQAIVNEHEKGAVAITLECRAWTCDHCRPVRRQQLIALAHRGTPERFITITVKRGKFDTPARAAAELASAWRLIAKRIRRAWPEKPLEYLCVFEATKAGWPHLHILQRGPYVPQRWLAEACREMLGSPICDIRAIKNRRMAVAYVAKYVGKNPHRFGSTKRYWTSGKWVAQDAPGKPVSTWGEVRWRISKEGISGLYDLWERQMKVPTMIDEWCVYYGEPPPWVVQSNQRRSRAGGYQPADAGGPG